ncbi:hypothetical protein FRC01_011255 [Tulasnella sp. 417]|nr:hypothetical protein FRC01_011255 [Tulasnella sp. 417]
MPHQPDYSDSDDESIHEELETGVLLGLPDGAVTSKTDLFDPAVSRMGGLPTFLPSTSVPSPDISHCKSCREPMELLIQVWCPFEQSPMDRLLYVWGCSRAGCQRKDGSVRAYRSVKFNARFAAKLERQKQKTKEKEEAKRRAAEEEAKKKASAAPASSTVKPNPFSLSSAASGPSNPSFSSPFGSGNLFAAPSAPPPSSKKVDEEEDDDSDDDEPPATEEEINELAEALESTTIDGQSAAKSSANAATWATAPSFKPLYLSSVSEYLVPEAKPKQLIKNVKVSDGLDDLDAGSGGGRGGAGGKWKTETYEKGASTDEIFSRFSKRVVNEGKQCLRYELSGVPLPYHNDSVYKKLFAPTPSTAYNVTRPSQHATTGRTYDRSWIPKCPTCGSPRTFEAQLMPNLITVLRRAEDDAKRVKQSDVERRNELARVLLKQNPGGGGGASGTAAGSDAHKTGMEWGTCMVFSCLGDCRVAEGGSNEQVGDCWREEFVLIQWE